MLKINEVARRTGVTVRTLHYYDEIGLLKPSNITDKGYRLYDTMALETLQQILFFRELDFPLNEIKEIMANPNYNKVEALTKHKEMLIHKRNRLNALVDLVDTTLKGQKELCFQPFDRTEMEASKKKYAAEVKERWGKTAAYAQSEEKSSRYDNAQWGLLSGEGEALLRAFGENRFIHPGCRKAQALVEQWQAYITAGFYQCTNDILSCLGQMYTGDARFTQNIDRNGEGTAAFMAAAIEVYCAK